MDNKFQYVLFDLDGTLTDPKEGICKSVQYALHRMNIEEPDLDKLEPFIGPPLEDSFMDFYKMSKAEAAKAISHYRERFSAIGLFENTVYPGIPELLAGLKEAGIILAVASSKPEVFVKRILKHFHLDEYFDVVVGSELDGRRGRKEEVVEEALAQLYGMQDHREGLKENISKDQRSLTAMVGDRIFDMNGAKEYGLHGVAVAFGYAPEGELEQSGAEYIAETVKDLENYLLGKESLKLVTKRNKKNRGNIRRSKENQDKINQSKVSSGSDRKKESGNIPENSFFRAIYMIIPYVVNFVVLQIVTYVGMKIVQELVHEEGGALSDTITDHSSVLAALISLIAVLCSGIVLWLAFHKHDPIPCKAVHKKNYGLAVLAGALLAMGFNTIILYLYTIMQGDGELYAKAAFNGALPLGMAIILYIVVSPVVEELLFRWLLYGRISNILGAKLGIVLTAAFFGFYHGNLLQGIYAALMGVFLALLLYLSDQLLLPVLFHMAANAVVYFSAYAPEKIQILLSSPIVGIIWMAVGIVLITYMGRNLKSETGFGN